MPDVYLELYQVSTMTKLSGEDNQRLKAVAVDSF